jgi:hypothetical protein
MTDANEQSIPSRGSLLLYARSMTLGLAAAGFLFLAVPSAVERWPRWVSVRERLPPADDGTPDATVLVWNRTDVIQAWREQDGHFTGVTGEHIPRVTHWMKMPEPPRE